MDAHLWCSMNYDSQIDVDFVAISETPLVSFCTWLGDGAT